MSQPRLLPVDQPHVSPLTISDRLRGQLVYFMTPPGSAGVPVLGEDEYWIARDEVGSLARRRESSTWCLPSIRPTQPRSS